MRIFIYSLLVLGAVGVSQVSAVHAQSLRDHIMQGLNDPNKPAPPTETESARDRMQGNTTQSQQGQQQGKPTRAQRYNDARQRMLDQEFTADQRRRMMQKMIRRDLVLATGDEPFFEPVKYKKIPPAGSLSERINHLVHGISIDVPPQYDPYGHEVRRYMASIGGPDVFSSREALQAEIANIKKAEIVMDYWIKQFRKEVKAIEAEIEERDAPSSTRTSLNTIAAWQTHFTPKRLHGPKITASYWRVYLRLMKTIMS